MRLTAFRVGLLAGLGLFLAPALMIWLIMRADPEAPYDFEGATVGVDLSRHGARTIEVFDDDRLLLRQTCNGICDDLSYKRSAGEVGMAIHVRDAVGRCLSCTGGVYASGGLDQAPSLSISGVDKLEARAGFVRRQPDGSTRLVGPTRVLDPPPNPKP